MTRGDITHDRPITSDGCDAIRKPSWRARTSISEISARRRKRQAGGNLGGRHRSQVPAKTWHEPMGEPTIAGSIPHPLGRPAGCAFHPRCPDAIPGLCDRRTPALRPVGAQSASCFLYHADEAAP